MLVVVAVEGGWIGCLVALSVIANRVNYDVVGGSISTGRPSSPIANTPIFTDVAMEEGGEVCACELRSKCASNPSRGAEGAGELHVDP